MFKSFSEYITLEIKVASYYSVNGVYPNFIEGYTHNELLTAIYCVRTRLEELNSNPGVKHRSIRYMHISTDEK